MVLGAGVLLTLSCRQYGAICSSCCVPAGLPHEFLQCGYSLSGCCLLVRPVATLALLGKTVEAFPAAVAEKWMPGRLILGGLHVSRRRRRLFAVCSVLS